jgi:hypothetical protein
MSEHTKSPFKEIIDGITLQYVIDTLKLDSSKINLGEFTKMIKAWHSTKEWAPFLYANLTRGMCIEYGFLPIAMVPETKARKLIFRSADNVLDFDRTSAPILVAISKLDGVQASAIRQALFCQMIKWPLPGNFPFHFIEMEVDETMLYEAIKTFFAEEIPQT